MGYRNLFLQYYLKEKLAKIIRFSEILLLVNFELKQSPAGFLPKMAVLKNFTKITGKHLLYDRVSFLKKSLEKRLKRRWFGKLLKTSRRDCLWIARNQNILSIAQ